jgi:hypothetical protein
MAAAMAGQKGYFAALKLAEDEWVGGFAKGRFDALFVDVGEAGHGVEPAAADNADLRLTRSFHCSDKETPMRAPEPPSTGRFPTRTPVSCKHLSIKAGRAQRCAWAGTHRLRITTRS